MKFLLSVLVFLFVPTPDVHDDGTLRIWTAKRIKLWQLNLLDAYLKRNDK